MNEESRELPELRIESKADFRESDGWQGGVHGSLAQGKELHACREPPLMVLMEKARVTSALLPERLQRLLGVAGRASPVRNQGRDGLASVWPCGSLGPDVIAFPS